MNFLQFGLFGVYSLSVLCAGAGLHAWLNGEPSGRLNRCVAFGESLLLGNIFLVGVLLALSLVGAFRAVFLWSAVAGNFLFLISGRTRRDMAGLFGGGLGVPALLFLLVVLVFVFRNCYFLIDVDSMSTYLYAQKLWLQAGTSLIGDRTFDIRLFNPQYDGIAYSLGISLFGQETLFPQLVTVLWRVICLLLVFGYTSYRLNGYYGLAAALFVVLNDHFFFAGANQWVTLNAAVIAFMFAAVYNFWEARRRQDGVRLFLALLFLSQLPGCKLYTVHAVFFLLLFGCSIQADLWRRLKGIVADRKYLIAGSAALVFVALWYVKNYLITGDPLFPFFSGRMHLWGWTPEHQAMFLKVAGGLSLPKLLKYVSFLFIWPGVSPAKYVLIGFLALPFLAIFIAGRERQEGREEFIELCFWLGVSLLALCGICLGLWQDPRPYRFPIGIFAFATVFFLRFVLMRVTMIRWEPLVAGLILILSLTDVKIVKASGGEFLYPSVKNNLDVLLDRMHMPDAVRRHYPEVDATRDVIARNGDKLGSSAWFVGDNDNGFLYPDRPRIALFFTTTLSWSDYVSAGRIMEVLQARGIRWVMTREEGTGRLIFISAEAFSRQAMTFDRNPKRTFYDYGFPAELTAIR
ncbi:MAG: hypothetical protein WCO69_03165 [Candidatus Omnitrophota bacterium]